MWQREIWVQFLLNPPVPTRLEEYPAFIGILYSYRARRISLKLSRKILDIDPHVDEYCLSKPFDPPKLCTAMRELSTVSGRTHNESNNPDVRTTEFRAKDNFTRKYPININDRILGESNRNDPSKLPNDC